MSASAPEAERFPGPNVGQASTTALLPLTVFDQLFERTTFVTGWLVEGKVDARVVEAALRRVTEKWRVLAGRLRSQKEGKVTKWCIEVPLGPLPPDYPTFALTTATSDEAITQYVPIPIPQVSSSLPPELFVDSSTPRQYTQWEATQHPLTAWHFTYFPARSFEPTSAIPGSASPQLGNGSSRPKSYTAIGFARSHGVFDGVGASFVMRALIAEMNGTEWAVPPPPVHATPSSPYVVNPLLQVLDQKYLTHDRMYKGYTSLGYTGLVRLIAWHVRERYWRGAERQICLLPKDAFDGLINGARGALRKEGKEVANVSSGDILVAWIYKTMYAKGLPPDTMVHVTNFASFRSVLTSSPTDPIAIYPHNAFLPLPYPNLSVSDVQSFSIHGLAALLTTCRLSLAKPQVVSAFKMLQTPHFPGHPDADDNITVSNVSASRILESDWSAAGAGKTVCGYRYQLTPTGVVFANAIYIAGRLADGTVVLDVTLNTFRQRLLLEAITALVDAAAESATPPSGEGSQ